MSRAACLQNFVVLYLVQSGLLKNEAMQTPIKLSKQFLHVEIRDSVTSILTLFRLGFLRVAQLGGGGGGRKVPAAYNYKTINDDEIKLGSKESLAN